MKHAPKRMLALLLCALMLTALLPVLSVTAAESTRVVWDMETLPDDLVSEALAVPMYPDSADYSAGNVTLSGVSGKGRGGSRALAVTQVGACIWSDIFTLYPERDYGASYDLGGAQTVWFWANASAFTQSISMDFRPDGRYPYIGDRYYICEDGKTEASLYTIPDAWDGIHGRIVIPAGFKGWIGVPLSSLVTYPDTLQSIYFYMSVQGADSSKSKTVYFDDFTLCGANTAPDGIRLPALSYAGTVRSDKLIWDMEKLPEDLLASGLAAVSPGAVRRNVRVQRAEGAGFGGSNALQLLQYGPYSETDMISFSCASLESFDANWRGGDLLLFWADASEFSGLRVSIALTVSGKRLSEGAFWCRERNGLLVKAGEADADGRLTLPEGFCGWVGIPLTGFSGGMHQASSLQLQLSYSGSTVQRRSLYLDEFRLLTGNRLPEALATGAGVKDTGIVLNKDAQPDNANYINVDIDTRYQTMQAYGASDCWWTNVIGLRSNIRDVLDLCWGKDGIGLNNYRLNVGGSVRYNRSDGVGIAGRAVLSPLNENGVLDIRRNVGSWNTYSALLDMVKDREAQIDDLTLFMNTPPSAYTNEGIARGGTLKPDHYDDYGRYVADVTAAYSAAGLPVKYVSPVNEPLMGFWTNGHSQEGMDYRNAEDITKVTEQCILAVEAAGLPTKVSASDFNTWNVASSCLDTLMANKTVSSHIDHISAHDYGWESFAARQVIAAQIGSYGLGTHMTEWAMARSGNEDTADSATELAWMLYHDLAATNVDTWSWWIAVGGGGCSDALMYYSTENSVIETNKRLWALGQHSLFTTGATRIGVNTAHLPSDLLVMAFVRGSSLVYVIDNLNSNAVTLSLAGLPAGSDGKLYATSAEYNCELLGHIDADRAITLPAKSVVTVVFDGIELDKVSSSAAPASPEDCRMLDMESCSAEEGFSAHQPSLVSAYMADGRGENDSRAIALSYNVWDNDMYWDACFDLDPAGLGGSTNWSAGDLMWFRVDASEFHTDLYLQLDIGDGGNRQQAIGAGYLLWDGETAPQAGTAVKTWDGATYGRMLIPAGFVGYIGIDFADYAALNRTAIRYFRFYFEPSQEDIPCALYLDDFWLTQRGSTPQLMHTQPQPVCKDIFDMECLQEDLTVSSAFSAPGGSLGNTVDAVVGSDYGFSGTQALGLRCITGSTAVLQLSADGLNGFDADWYNADRFWFWIDTRAFSGSLCLGAAMNDVPLSGGHTATLWDGENVFSAAVTNDGVVLPEQYAGFVGLPLAGFGDLSGIHTITFSYPSGSNALPVTLWLDEFWAISGDTLPPVTFREVEHIPFTKEIWNIDSIAAGFDNSSILTHYGDPLSKGNADAVVGSCGCLGSAALGYVFDGVWTTAYGDNNLYFTSLSAVGMDTNWVGADLLWFWVDAGAYEKPVSIRLRFDWIGPEIGTQWYLWDGENERVSAGTMKAAYGGADFGSFTLPQGYIGYVCLPLSAFRGLDLAKPCSMILHIDANSADLAALPKTIWFDEFWVTAEDGYPTVPVCAHAHTQILPGLAPTCLDAGLSEGLKCLDCGQVLTAQETLPALGHDFVDGICSRCGAEDPSLPPTDPCESYTDINRSAWYHAAADYVISKGYMGSTSTTALTFEPMTKVSRAMVASLLYRICGQPEVSYTGAFSDVPDGTWYSDAVEFAAQNRLASGIGDGRFAPFANVTRQELAGFLMNLAGYLGKDTAARVPLSAFADVSTVPGWSREYLQWAVAAKLISGRESGGSLYLAPADNAVRCELASMIKSFSEIKQAKKHLGNQEISEVFFIHRTRPL